MEQGGNEAVEGSPKLSQLCGITWSLPALGLAAISISAWLLQENGQLPAPLEGVGMQLL